MACPYLEYHREYPCEDDDETFEFDEPRAYCTVANTFVQPMRADICNDRYDLDHSTDCEIYLAKEHEKREDDQ